MLIFVSMSDQGFLEGWRPVPPVSVGPLQTGTVSSPTDWMPPEGGTPDIFVTFILGSAEEGRDEAKGFIGGKQAPPVPSGGGWGESQWACVQTPPALSALRGKGEGWERCAR